jgi:hypothetical protein
LPCASFSVGYTKDLELHTAFAGATSFWSVLYRVQWHVPQSPGRECGRMPGIGKAHRPLQTLEASHWPRADSSKVAAMENNQRGIIDEELARVKMS